MRALDPDRIMWAVQLACQLEVAVDKPGNVTWGKDFSDARFVDFVVSAVAIGPAFGNPAGASVGDIILRAVRDTRSLVDTNTNLGTILLLAPLAKAATLGRSQGLRTSVREVLAGLTADDAHKAYQAIRIAAPGGLGSADRYDVSQHEVDITLLEAMRLAQERDTVAREYVTDLAVTFELGYSTLSLLWAQGSSFSDAVVQTYLTILAQVPDTLVARKQGLAAARQVSQGAEQVLEAGGVSSRRSREALEAFDHMLRDDRHRLNPGTTADLVAATLFVFLTEGEGLDHLPELLGRW